MSTKFLAFADLHYDEMEDGDERLNKIVQAIGENHPDFCISLGDFCKPVEKNKDLIRRLDETGIPFYFSVGNHETDRHKMDEVLEFFGASEPYYSFEHEEFKFIVMNTCYCNKDEKDQPFYNCNFKEHGVIFPIVPDTEMAWLEEELNNEKIKIIFSHHSLVNEFANRGVVNRQSVQQLFQTHNVMLCMNGHDHGDRIDEKNGTMFYTVNSASYVWIGAQIASNEEYLKKYGHMRGILPYKDPFYVVVEIHDSKIKIQGMDGEYLSVTPEDVGLHDYKWNGVSILPKASSCERKY